MNTKQLPFFVYGTLMEGQYNHHHFSNIIKIEKDCYADGYEMFDSTICPVVFDGEGRVYGELFYIDEDRYQEILNKMDSLEECYDRKRTIVTSSDKEVEAWIYVGKKDRFQNCCRYNEETNGFEMYSPMDYKIKSGSWLEHFKNKTIKQA